MAHDSSARDLLRASVTDGDAVRRYLTSIEPHELSQLLDGLSSYHKEKQQQPQLPHLKSVVLVQDDWLPLLRLLVQCETTRLRTASHVLHALRRGRPSELESMQLLTEVSVGYSSALDRLQELQKTETTRRMVQRQTLLDEVHTVLDTVFCFLEEEVVVAAVSDGPVIGRESSGERSGNSVSCCSHRVRSNDKVKLLPQLLGLVSFFLGLCGELQTRGEQGKSGVRVRVMTASGGKGAVTLARLLELPWDCCTVPSLLDVLADDASLMSRESWQGLQETVERLVTSSTEMASETMNPMIRECVTVASVTGEHKWIAVARYLLQQLPVQLRQEAEFNLQMSLRHSQCIVSLICESIRSSRIPGVVPEDADSQCNDPQCSSADVRLGWRDLLLLLHALQASKPILHHRTSSSRVATEASVFTEIEHLAWLIVHSDVRAFVDYASTKETQSRSGGKTLEKYVLDQVGLVLNFGGKQVHAREWKALLLMDIVFYWIEQSNTTCAGDKPATAKSATALMLLQAIFETAPEARFEVLSSLFERSQKPAQRKIAGEILSQLFVSHSAKLFPHLNAIQDWLSMQFHRSFDSARDFFLIASNLATVYKDLYNFLMVFLRKLLSTGNRLHQQYVVDMWCTWLDRQLPFNEQQEEEIVSALINSMIASRDIQAWSFGRLAQVFNCRGGIVEGPVILLRKSSWEKFYRFLSQEVGKFLLPTTSGIMEYGIEEEEDSADENDDDDMGLQRFRVTALDAFYQQNASLDGAASTGLIFQKLLSCLIAFENGICRSKVSSEGLPIEGLSENDSDIKQWFIDLVSSWKYFFHWLCQDSEVLLNQPAQGDVREKTGWWKLVARVYIGCAVCNLAIELLMRSLAAGNFGKRDEADRDLVTFDTDGCRITVWSLMEVEFSLHRMIQKLVSRHANGMGTSLSKEYVKSTSDGLHRVLQPAMLRMLTAIKGTVQETLTSNSAEHERPSAMSFDAVLFALDSCCRTTSGDDDLFGASCSRNSEADDLDEGASILELLLRVYIHIRDYVVPVSNKSGADGVKIRGEGEEKSVCRLRLSLYADSISAKFPAFARQLVAPGKCAKAVVLLDTKSGEEMLERVCAAIGRTLEMMIRSSSLRSAHDRLGQMLLKVSWNGFREPTEVQKAGKRNSFACLSGYFLDDVKDYVQLDGFTKTSVSCASLCKRLLDNTAEMVDPAVDCVELCKLSSLAYDILCENVVYNARLLRLLMNICLPTHLALHIQTFVTLESKIEAFIQTCGIHSAEHVEISTSEDCHQRRPALAKTERRSGASACRKRLRQRPGVRSPYSSGVDSDSDFDASYPSDSDLSDDIDATTDSRTNTITSQRCAPFSLDCVPHLQSHATQRIAIGTVLAALEQSQSTLLHLVTTKNKDKEAIDHEALLGYIRIHEVVNKAISANVDFLWETRKVLLKVLHMIELGLRIGKAIGALQRRRDDLEVKWHDTAICIYEFSVTSALRNRIWAGGIKDASEDAETKTKISATLLKTDIFLLQAPGIVQTWLKETSIPSSTKERLKSLMTMVKDRIAPTSLSHARRGKAKARQRLLGVVPIVRKRKKRLRSRHPVIDAFLNEEDGADAFADLEDFIE